MKNFLLLLALLSFWIPTDLFAQDFDNNKDKYQLKIKKTDQPIQLDGQLIEPAWQTADKAKNFWIKFPQVKENANPQSEAMLTFDDRFLYVGIKCYGNSDYIVTTLKRDQDYWDADAVGIVLDPVNEASNGFMFGVTPLGVQMEGLLNSSGGGSDIDRNWDNKWFSEAKIYNDYFIVEMAIPFKTLRYEAGRTQWGVNFIRNNPQDNEFHTWTPIPQQFDGIDLNYTGLLVWETAPKKVKGNINLIPYITGGLFHDIENNEKVNGTFNAGIDAKIAVTSSLNLDLTLNPDFSQIEVDDQVTNLSRFSIRLPEKRTFFLENADIFGSFGTPVNTPFLSRRIGLNDDGETIPILFGARLSGNLDSKTRIGAMTMQTKGDDSQTGQNYTTVAVHRRLFKRSIVKGLFTNRQGFEDGDFSKTDYGRNAGIDVSFSNDKGTLQTWGGFFRSFKDGFQSDRDFLGLGGGYFSRNLQAFSDFNWVGENYFADVGFINRVESFFRDTSIRQGYFQNFTQVDYYIFPEDDDVINSHWFGWENFLVYNDGEFNERFIRWRYFMNLKNSSALRFRLDNNKTFLPYALTFTGDDEVKPGTYNTYSFNIQFDSDQRKRFTYGINFRHGGFFDGTLSTYSVEANYRQQPWGNFGLELEKNDIRFPGFETTEFIALTSRIEVNFSKKIFWTTFSQYNFFNERFNINSRLQYRFSPMSDFFIVYTDNYDVTNNPSNNFLQSLQPKNRALVFKLNYWFSI